MARARSGPRISNSKSVSLTFGLSSSQPGSLIVGQDRVVRVLGRWLAADHRQSLLFIGQAGVGKRTAALRLAQAANCQEQKAFDPRDAAGGQEPTFNPCGDCRACRSIASLTHPDVKLVFPIKALSGDDAKPEEYASETTSRYPEYCLGRSQPVPDPRHQIHIGTIRWLRSEMSRAPLAARQRFVIILMAHRMNEVAANALLKILEEPQEQTTFVLTTDNLWAVPDTIRSRCAVVRFGDLTARVIQEWLMTHRQANPEQAALAGLFGAGSLGLADRFLTEPEAVLSQSIVDYFCQGTGQPLQLLEELADTPAPIVVGTFLFLYRQAMRYRLGAGSDFIERNPAARRRIDNLQPDYLRRAVKYLLARKDDCSRYGVNPRLAAYTLLAALRN